MNITAFISENCKVIFVTFKGNINLDQFLFRSVEGINKYIFGSTQENINLKDVHSFERRGKCWKLQKCDISQCV